MTQKEDIKNAIDAMKKGGVILYPTDTVWDWAAMPPMLKL